MTDHPAIVACVIGAPPAATLADILITEQLAQRPQRDHDYKAEAELLHAIAGAHGLEPSAMLDELLQAAMTLCGAHSAGISVAGLPDAPEVFRWTNLAGVYAPHVGGCTPVDFSPCGVTAERGTAQLFERPGRYFTYFQGVSPALEEGLVVPFEIGGGLVGTMWIVSHDPGPAFDREHVRVLERITRFAGSAVIAAQERQQATLLAQQWRERAASVTAGLPSGIEGGNQEGIRSLIDAGTALASAWERSRSLQHAAEASRRRAVRAQEQAEVLIDIGQALTGELDAALLGEMIARLSCQALGAPLGAFLALTDETDGQVPILSALVVERGTGSAPPAPAGNARIRAMPVTSTVSIADLMEESPSDPVAMLMRQIPSSCFHRSCLLSPVRSDSGTLLGCVVVADPHPLAFSPRHERVLAGLVGIAAQSLGNAHRFHEEREIRLQIEERERLARLHGDIGRALIAPIPIEESLNRCCTAILTSLDASFVRIWVLDQASQVLVLRTSVGMYIHLDGPHARIPVGAFKIGRIAQSRQPHVTNTVETDPEIGDHAWARREGMVAFAGYPLTVGDEVLGVIGLFACHELSTATIELLSAASIGIAAKLDRQRKTERLEETMSQLRQSNSDLDRFTAIASHDLLEPTRTVTSFLDLLQRRNGAQLDESGHGYVRHARDASARMSALIRSMLDYARITGTVVGIVPVTLDEPVADALANLAIRIAEVEAVIETGPLPQVQGDRALLGQLFQNLLANALKFRRPGISPRIAITAEEAGAEWRVFVTDDGIGIPAEHRQRIFEMFQRLHTEAAYAGSGIGLATCRRLMERMHGRIWVEERGGPGATFGLAFRKTA